VPEESAAFTWTVYLAREEPLKTALALFLIAAIAFAGWVLAGPFPAAAASLVTILSLCEFLFPVSYEVSQQGARVRSLLKTTNVTWSQVGACYLDDNGVKLSPFNRPSRLEAFRGLYLRFAGNEDEVVQAVRLMRGQQCS